jgi:hypothetical protein
MEVAPITTTIVSTHTEHMPAASTLLAEEPTHRETQSPSVPSSSFSFLNVRLRAGTPGNLLAFFALGPGQLETTIGGTVYVSTTTKVFSMHTLTEYAPLTSTLSTEQPEDTAAATAEEGMGDLPASSSTSLVQPTPRSGAEEAEEESGIARRSKTEALFRWSEAEASFRRKTGLEVIKDFFSRLFGWDEEPKEEHSHIITEEVPLSSSPPSNNKAVLQELGTHYAFMFG